MFQQAADAFNARNGVKPGDPRYIGPQMMKAWAMVESGGSKSAFLSDPFQVNKTGDWDDAKMKIGLSKGQTMTPDASANAALLWLDKKSYHTDKTVSNGIAHFKTVYRSLRFGLSKYNANNNIDENGLTHAENYVDRIFSLIGK